MEFFFSLFIRGSVFDVQNLNPMSIFISSDLKTTIIRKKTFFRIIENIRYGSRVYLRHAAMGLTRRFTSSHAASNRRYCAA